MAKRVNKKFLVILTASVMGTGIAAVAVSKLATRGDASAMVAAGDRAAAAGEWEKAQAAYADALRRTDDVDVIVKYGDAVHELVRNDPNLQKKDLMAWERAVQIKPDHAPALQRLMDSAIKTAEFHYAAPEAWDQVRDRANRLHAVDPDNARARAWTHMAVIYAWLAAKPVGASEIDKHLAALAELSAKDPADATIPFVIARAYLRRAEEALPRGADAVRVERDKALAAFGALKGEAQRNNAALMYRYSLVLGATADQNLDTGRRDGARVQEARDLLYKANLIVEPGQELYDEIKLAYVQDLRGQKKFDDAEREARKYLERSPDEMRARLALAGILRFQPGKREEAIKLLEQPPADDASLKGYAGLRAKQDLDGRRLVDLVQLRLDHYADPKTPDAQREPLRAQMDEELRRLGELTNADNPLVLKLKGLVRLLGTDRESLVAGIRLLEEAHNKLNRANNRMHDPDLALRLASAYLIARDPRDRQPEQAKQLYATIASAQPRLWVARKKLTELYLRDREYDRARPHVEAMANEPELKDDAEVLRYRIVLLAGLGKLDEVKRMALALPEQTAQEQWLKVNALQAATLDAEAEAVARKLSDAELADAKNKEYPGTAILAQILKRGGKGEDAMALVRKAMAKSPGVHELEVLELVLQGKLNQANERIVAHRVADDPMLQAIAKAHFLNDQGKTEEAIQALLEEDRRKPNSPLVMEEIFQFALSERKLDVAEQYGRKLKEANADQANGLSYEARLKLARRDLDGAMRDAQELARTDTRAGAFVVLGQVQQAMQQHDAAVISYKKALDRQSDNYEALRGIVECYLTLNQVALAEDFVRQGLRTPRLAVFFQEVQRRIVEHHRDPRLVTADRAAAIEKNPDVPRGYVALAENHLKVANYLARQGNDMKGAEAEVGKAIEVMRKAVARWPDDLVLTGRLAEMYMRPGKVAEAVAAVEALAAREQWKDKPEPQQLLASLHLRNNQGLKANEAMERALKLSNNSFAVRRQMADFLLQTGQVDRCVDLLKKLVEERPDDRAMRTQLIEMLIAARRNEEADAVVAAALAGHPNDARMIAMRGFVRLNEGRTKEAHELLDAALRIDSSLAPAHYFRGLLKLRANDLAGAAEDVGRARDLSPANVDWRLTMAEILRRRGQTEESTKELEVALQRDPMRKELRQRLFDLYLGERRWVALERLLDDAKNNPDLAGDPAWRKAEARMWLTRDNPQRALVAIEVASRLAPQDPEANLQYLEIQHRLKNYDVVLDVTDKVMAGPGPKPWWMYVQRAQTLAELKRTAEAESALEGAMAAVDLANDSYGASRTAQALEKVVGPERAIEKLEPRVKPYWAMEVAQIRMERQQWQKAVEVADQILQKEFDNLTNAQKLRALTLAGQIYTSSVTTVNGSLEKAEQAYVRFLSESEKQQIGVAAQLQALNNLAFLFSDHPTTPDPKRALGYSKRAYDLMTMANAYDVSVADTHGWVLVLNDRTDEGIEVLRGALAKKALPDTHYHLGEAYLRKGQYSEAKISFDEADRLLKRTKQDGGFVDPGLQDKLSRAVDRMRTMNKSANAGGN